MLKLDVCMASRSETSTSGDFQNKLVDRVQAAIGYATERGSGKAAEFNFLHQALINSFGL